MKIILTPFSGHENSTAALKAAFLLAKDFKGCVRCLHTTPDPETPVFPFNEAALYMPENFKEEVVRSNNRQLQQARKVFTAMAEYVGFDTEKAVQAQFIHLTGPIDTAIVQEARFADIICMRLSGDKFTPAQDIALHAALFETGRPVLLLPEKEEACSNFGKRIAIAWNNSKESAIAVDHALPFLKKAESVAILTISENGKEKDPFKAGRLKKYLEYHGVSGAEIRPLKENKQSPGKALLAESKRLNATMLIMGAFTHHRLRQLVLGGVTHYVLEHGHIPVLTAH